ncbi:hypothetical protein BSL78_24799 [Apostichopus japonicus]|uniref:Homocysteine-responsive endoplasmic reticulum-resident ubiquitin-like domain member 2 protein n=1 Tax=Stichopus japonicus TaxID=307972 RepID=A0A2G8JRH1_STIJA|nr:hypothetical protein BSL78_24799 [Apostichopus japonicus]
MQCGLRETRAGKTCLKQVYKDTQIDDDTLHTVHLVCTPTPEELAESDKLSKSSNPAKSSRSSIPGRREDPDSVASTPRRTSVEQPTVDGIRQRHAARTNLSGTTGYSTSYLHQYSVPGSPSAYQNMSPQQLQWMQHLYMQQMAAAYYMQYQAAPGMSPPWIPSGAYQFPQPMEQPPIPNFNAPGNQPVPVVNNNNAMPRVAAANVDGPRNAPRVQNQQMNAGVGPAMNDDEEEGANRDWLDWIYTLCRFGVLLSIVYFYSSMNRFLLVAGIMFLVYLYEHNFFRLRRAAVARVQVEERIDPLENRHDAADRRQDDTPDEQTNEDNSDTTPSTDENNASSNQTENVEESARPESNYPPGPGFFGTVWIFVSTFFTSLIPQGPQHLNVN